MQEPTGAYCDNAASSRRTARDGGPRPRSSVLLLATLVIGGATGCGGGAEIPYVDITDGPRLLTDNADTPAVRHITRWTAEVRKFWVRHYDAGATARALRGQLVEFVDAEAFDAGGRLVHGYTVPGRSVVGMRRMKDGTIDLSYVQQLYKHELGHVVLIGVGVAYDEQFHHEIFRVSRYGY